MTRKVLLPVDGSESSLRAAQHVAALARALPHLEVHLVNVQPHGDDWMVRRVLAPDRLERLEREWAESALAPARAVLAEAGAHLHEHFEQGDVAKTIVRLADELGCDLLVMGTRGLSSLNEILLGSVANKVLHLARTPITLVK